MNQKKGADVLARSLEKMGVSALAGMGGDGRGGGEGGEGRGRGRGENSGGWVVEWGNRRGLVI